MKQILIAFLCCFTLFPSCDSGAICTSVNRNVVVENNTGFELDVVKHDGFNSLAIGNISPFEVKTFNIEAGLMIQAGNAYFSDQLYVDPCRQTFILTVED